MNSKLCSDFNRFYLICFSPVLGSNPKYMTLSGHVYLATSGLWQFVRISLFFMTFIILRVYSQVFYKMFLKLDSSDIFLTVWLELWGSWEEDQRCETPFSTYQFKGIFLTRRSSLMLCALITWLRYCLLDFSTIKSFSFSPAFPYSVLWQGWGLECYLLDGSVSIEII